MPRRAWVVPLALLALAGAASCGGGQPTGAAAPTASAAAAPATPLHGSWRLELTEAQLGAALTAGGYGDLTDEFLAAEEIEGAVTQVLTVEDDRFSFAYQSGDDPWHVGWEGPVDVAADTVTLHDDLSPSRDTLRWSTDGDQLSFELAETNDVLLKGLPNEVYLRAYLTAAPFVLTDCVPTAGSC